MAGMMIWIIEHIDAVLLVIKILTVIFAVFAAYMMIAGCSMKYVIGFFVLAAGQVVTTTVLEIYIEKNPEATESFIQALQNTSSPLHVLPVAIAVAVSIALVLALATRIR